MELSVGRAGTAVRALARTPALHFLVIGAALAALDAATSAPRATTTARAPIVITAARIAEIRDDYTRDVAAPSPAELDALVARAADEEMLYREAVALGLDRGDRAVKWRIVEKMHFLYGDDAGDAETAYRRGIAIGLDRDDVVVRNALVTKMRLMAKAASKSDEPTGAALDRELEAFLQAHGEEYRQAARVSLTQVFLNAATHGAALEADARALAERLAREHTAPAAATHFGDPFIAGGTFRDVSPRGLAKTFGDEFAATVGSLPLERWSTPIASPYGVHLVWVSARAASELPPLAAVRTRVLRAYRAERRARYLGRMMDELRAAYPVEVQHAG
jgi:hypothetical protein